MSEIEALRQEYESVVGLLARLYAICLEYEEYSLGKVPDCVELPPIPKEEVNKVISCAKWCAKI